MKLQILFVLIFLGYKAHSKLNSDNKEWTQKFIISKDPVQNYRKLCTTLVRMMENSRIAKKRNLDVLIFSMVPKNFFYNFEGFHAMFNKVGSDIITTRGFTLSAVDLNVYADFVIVLLFNNVPDYEDFINAHFYRIFPDTSIRMFLVVLNTDNTQLLLSPFNALAKLNYHNLYGILQHNLDVVQILRIKMKKSSETLYLSKESSTGDKFEMLSEVLKKGDIKIINIVHFDMYPLTYVKDGIIYGADGNLIRELCKKYEFSYRIFNKNNEQSIDRKLKIALSKGVDILLTTNMVPIHDKMMAIWLNEMDGGCLLVPRNIQISSIDNLVLPFDCLTLVFIVLSVTLLIVFWKIIAIVNGTQMSTMNIVLDVYQLTFGMGISTLNRLTLKEKFMIMCFIFGSFILATTYQSIILALMLMDPAMRSANNLQELNASDTKFYMFYDQNIEHAGDPLFIRRELILNVRNFDDNMDLPRDLDSNLVYFIGCKYASIFIQTPKNFRDGKRLFDRLTLAPMLQRYSARTDFYFKEEFALFVSALTESGIYGFWDREFINSINEDKDIKHDYETMIQFHNMKVPFIILSSGYLIALHAFVIEKLIKMFLNRRWNFLLCNSITRKREFFKIRENSNYLSKAEKIKKRKQKKNNKIIIVEPCVDFQKS